jgi:LemA protein
VLEPSSWWADLGPWISAAVAALLMFWMLGAYNRLVRLRGAITSAWAQVEAQLQRRALALPELVAALREPLASEHRALDAVLSAQAAVLAAAAKLKSAPVQAAATAELTQALAALDAALARTLALMEQQPALRAVAELAQTRRELHDSDLRLAFARQLYNDAAHPYDEALRQWPTRLLRRLYRFELCGRL